MIYTSQDFFNAVGGVMDGVYDLQVTPDASQSIKIAVAGVSYQVDLLYNPIASLWFATVTDLSNNKVLCSSHALQVGRLAMGHWDTQIALVVTDFSASRISPITIDDLGRRNGIYIIDKTNYQSVWPELSA